MAPVLLQEEGLEIHLSGLQRSWGEAIQMLGDTTS